jgi:two-component system sensor histidine kinase DesK
VLKSELAAKLIDRDSVRAGDEMREVERVSRDALTQVRRAVRGFRDANLADEVLRARAVLETAGVRVHVDVPPLTGRLERSGATGTPSTVEHAAAMILREAVTNVVRHAKATQCRISARSDADSLVMRIEDDGVGGRVVEGAGIESMRARAREIGGSLEYHPADTRTGLAVTLRVPLRPTQ